MFCVVLSVTYTFYISIYSYISYIYVMTILSINDFTSFNHNHVYARSISLHNYDICKDLYGFLLVRK